MQPEEDLLVVRPLPAMAAEAAAMGRDSTLGVDPDARYVEQGNVSLTARKAWAVMKITGALMKGIVVHPGGDAPDTEIEKASRDLMARASELTNAAIELARLDRTEKTHATLINGLCVQSAEIVSMNWRMSHATGQKALSVKQLQHMLSSALEGARLEDPQADHGALLDLVTAKRVALLGVVPDIHQAVSGFDYFAPDPEQLVLSGVRCVLEMVDEGMEALSKRDADAEINAVLAQSLVAKFGELYVANYRSRARADVHALRALSPIERHRRIHEHRLTGLPTDHVDASFKRLASRMLQMVSEAVPLLTNEPEPQAPGPIDQLDAADDRSYN